MKFSHLLLVCAFFSPLAALPAELGLDRVAYGVTDRSGGHSVITYPFTRGQEIDISWTEVNPGRSNFNWSAIDAAIQVADDQNQVFLLKVGTVGSGGVGNSVPPWMSEANGGGVPFFKESGAGAATQYTYGYYLDPDFKIYFSEMIHALGKHLRTQVPANLRERIVFVRCDTGATGDEQPYENGNLVPAQYQISDPDWQDYRIWAFGVHDQALQEGEGPPIPILFQDIETPKYQAQMNWVRTNVTSGFGAKYVGIVRGHHLTGSQGLSDSYRALAVDSPVKLFSRNEMDGTWTWTFFQNNIKLSMYWCAVEQLHPGLSIWDVTGSCLESSYASGYGFTFDFFNKWAAELDPATARGGFCILHEGLDSSDTGRFPTDTYGSPANQGNTNRYANICAAYASQGARMDHLEAATWGNVKQRPNQTGYNDAGWKIVPGNYERFITQLNPTNTSKGAWRINGATNGLLTVASHPFDRFARSFDHASGKDAMYFNIHTNLLPSPGQRVQLSVIYRNSGTGQFALLYDALTNSQKTAFTVIKTNSNEWLTNSVIVTDWAFGTNGSSADVVLTNLSAEDDIFHSVELVKLVEVTMNTVGQGTVSARNDATVYSPVSGTYAEGLRLEMTVTPAPGWKFSGWSGDLSGTNSRAILFPTNVNTQVTANFTSISPTYTLTVNNGSGSGSYTNGQQVAISANALQGQAFVQWIGDTQYVNNVTAPNALVRMSTNAVTLTATYVGAVPATIAVVDSTGGETASMALPISQVFPTTGGNVLVVNLFYKGVDGNYPTGPLTLDWVTSGGTVTQTMTRAVQAGNTAAKAFGSSIYYLWNPVADAGGTISGSLPVGYQNQIISAFTLSGVDTNASPITASAINDNSSGATSITSSTAAGVPAGGFAALGSGSAANASGTGFAASAIGGTPVNWFVNSVGGGDWYQGYISNLVTTTTNFTCTHASAARLHIVAAVFSPGISASANLAPVFTVKPISRPDAGAGVVYSNTLAGSATDADAGDTLTYSKLSGPPWLNVATNGTLSGTPGAADVGTNVFTVKVADAAAAFDTATLNIVVQSAYAVWANQYQLVQGPSGNDDGDRLSNLGEFAFGGNPTNSSDLGYPITYRLNSAGGTNWFEYVHPQRNDPNSGLLYYLQLSDNLVSPGWTNTGYTVIGSGPLTNGFVAVTNRIETNVKSQQFIRLVVEKP